MDNPFLSFMRNDGKMDGRYPLWSQKESKDASRRGCRSFFSADGSLALLTQDVVDALGRAPQRTDPGDANTPAPERPHGRSRRGYSLPRLGAVRDEPERINGVHAGLPRKR